ncbi:ATP-binding protein [Streptomyces sp. NBC_01451]|uniref:ATP-binding protein n=1 Tax=Streptomyces sp. NBC_01451 TaxID=2903872 RepID=UPI002E36B141|nr:ATP-binding protein [Streptomyces sp. NBC_01451]
MTTTAASASVGPQRYQERYAARPEAARQARRDIAQVLESWGLFHLIEVAEQIVTELFANALEHTDAATIGTSITQTGEETVRIVVTDTSRASPTPAGPSCDAENGRGLLLVDALAHDWGSEPVHGGKRVWAELRGGGPLFPALDGEIPLTTNQTTEEPCPRQSSPSALAPSAPRTP